MAARHKEGYPFFKKGTHQLPCVQRSNDRRRRGVEGHRVLRETRMGAGFKTPHFR